MWNSIAGRLASMVVHSPLPDPIIAQWPPFVALAVLFILWRRRVIVGWLVPRHRGMTLAMAGAAGALLLLAVATHVKVYGLVMSDNGLCRGCRLFTPSSRQVVHPDLGNYPQAGTLLSGMVNWSGKVLLAASPGDTFPHARHSRLACLSCHDLRSKRRLTFEAPRGCQVCHHRQPARSDCATCHQSEELAEPQRVRVRVAVPRHPPRPRDVAFEHGPHEKLACTTCHAQPVSLAPADSVRTCTSCHANHHAEGRACASCHRTGAIIAPHQPPVQAHQACAACHTAATVTRLVPVRSFCLTCHSDDVDHFTPKECTACHFQNTPAEFQPRLQRTGGGS